MTLKLFSKDSPLNTRIISDVIIKQVYKVLVIGNSKEKFREEHLYDSDLGKTVTLMKLNVD
ncbi:hypothetical protein IGI04_005957 [Brassica rapa subsp. trilocularis]|uniref:Uncharacterized protein n=1 Tax=Brassica rapa subsp. trilocularis TaxID=1813537 RepID=A0ABQ7NFG2_BRACM|nr:hypothetical protein IGI04_005957 [Brassica rapa subsp. trilocularis]